MIWAQLNTKTAFSGYRLTSDIIMRVLEVRYSASAITLNLMKDWICAHTKNGSAISSMTTEAKIDSTPKP